MLDVRSTLIPRRDTVLVAIARTRQHLIDMRSSRQELGMKDLNNGEYVEAEKRRLRMMENFLEATYDA